MIFKYFKDIIINHIQIIYIYSKYIYLLKTILLTLEAQTQIQFKPCTWFHPLSKVTQVSILLGTVVIKG